MFTIHVIISIILILIGIGLTKKIFNPLTLFNVLWLVIISLYELHLSRLLVELSTKTYIGLLCNVIFFSFGFIITYCIRLKSNIDEESCDLNMTKLEKIFKIWIFIELLEVIYSGGMPFIWKLIGSEKTYMSF